MEEKRKEEEEAQLEVNISTSWLLAPINNYLAHGAVPCLASIGVARVSATSYESLA